ncbi:hypothetical protein MACJ_001660 [Theileria orientalis]|uniref:Uncharacterized protein n=1 Tax=Theileria orientalis TaxID=68886 RepID=A0A976QWB3_THEOR|nr:hypothetical protein MACJ_001660 [Theileria orientalis]
MCRESDESPLTLEIPDEFPDPVGPEIVANYLKNHPFQVPLDDFSENEIDPGALVSENTVDEIGPENVEPDTKVEDPHYGIPIFNNPDERATEEELNYIYEKARLATLYLLSNNKKKPSENSLILPNIGPDERLPIQLNLDCLEHWYLNCEFDGNARIYKVKKNLVFVKVAIDINSKDSSYTTIWKSKSYYEFANKIVANGLFNVNMTNKVSVFLENGEIKHYIKNRYGWVERSHCIEIYINFSQCTYDYLHSEDGCIDIYTPRYDFKISKLKLGKGKLPFKSYLEVWEAKNEYEYAKKVECIRRNTKSSSYIVIMIYLFDGDLIKLINRGKEWYRVDPKLVLIGPLYLDFKDDFFSYHFYDNVTYKIFEAKEGYCFNSLKTLTEYLLSEVVVWKAQNFNECAYKVMIDGIKFVTDTKNIIIYHVSGKCTQLKLIDKKWVVIDPSIILDINDKESNLGYNHFKDNGEIEYFIPNGDIVFKEVIAISGFISTDILPIWKAKTKYEYAFKAIVIKLDKNEKYLVLLLVNKDILLFHRLDKGHSWVQRSTDNSSLHELKMMKVDLSDPRVLNKRTNYKVTNNSIEIISSEPSLVAEPQPVVPVSKPIPALTQDKLLDLDIAKVYGIRGYDIFYKNDKLIFEAKDNYFFKLVTKNKEILWQPKNNSDLPNKVLYKRVNNTDKIKVYFPDIIKEEPPKPKPKLSFDPSTIQVEVSKCKKPGSELYKGTVVEVSGTPVTNTFEDPEDLFVPPTQPRQNQWVIDDD